MSTTDNSDQLTQVYTCSNNACEFKVCANPHYMHMPLTLWVPAAIRCALFEIWAHAGATVGLCIPSLPRQMLYLEIAGYQEAYQ